MPSTWDYSHCPPLPERQEDCQPHTTYNIEGRQREVAGQVFSGGGRWINGITMGERDIIRFYEALGHPPLPRKKVSAPWHIVSPLPLPE